MSGVMETNMSAKGRVAQKGWEIGLRPLDGKLSETRGRRYYLPNNK